MICGSLGKEALAAVGLANSVIYALGHVLGLGLVTACDTLFSQLYGSPSRHRIGMLLQKSVTIISLVPLLCSAYFLNLEPLLLLIGTEPDVAKAAAEYVAWFYPGLFFCFNSYILSRYLQAQDKAFVPLTAALLANAVNLGLNYLLVIQMQLGLKASAVSLAVSFGVQLVFQAVYAFGLDKNSQTWRGFKKEALLDWTSFIKLAGSGVCHVVMEIICWEMAVLMSGLWLALIITLAFLSFIFLIMSNCLNWNNQATKVQAVIGNAIESAIFERTLGRPSEMAPLLRRRLLSQPPQNISVILENSEANVARSIEPTNERSLYSYTTNTNLVMRSSFIPMHGPAPMVLPLPTRVSRRKFKKILLLRFAILVVCLLFLIGSILTRIFIPVLFPVWFPQDERNKTLASMHN
ncbi:hypothetical protein AAHC03_013634 [Spirometra sp. Aus1]